MNTLDIILILLFVPGIIRGLSKGFLEQAVAIVGILVSAYAAFHFSGAVCLRLAPYLPTVSETTLTVISFVLVLAVILLLTVLGAKLITKVVEMALLGWLNRALGLVGAILVTALVVGIGIVLFDTLNVKFGLVQESTLNASILYGPLKDFGYFIFPYLKELLLKK